VATYIPELAKADPEWFGICVATTDGAVYEVGDSRQPFTIQSISKPFTYGLAIEDRGLNPVLAKIGVEPSGEAFNSINLAPDSGCPRNPMINAGAIVATSLIAGTSPENRLERLLAVLSAYAGHPLAVDPVVYESERSTGHRNRAIGHLLRNFEVLTGDPDEALDLYFRQCSVTVDCRDLGVMAASGNLYCTGDPDRAPVRCAEPVAYAHTGPEAAFAQGTAAEQDGHSLAGAQKISHVINPLSLRHCTRRPQNGWSGRAGGAP
jgi:glutaminase